MKTNVLIRKPQPKTHEGAPAARIGAEAELRRSLMACMLWEDSFYETGVDIANRIASLVAEVKPQAVAALAVEARTKMNLRHAPLHVVIAMLASPTHRAFAGAVIPQVCLRADEPAELLAMYWKDGRKPLAAQLKRGLATAMRRFDAYQLAKYNRDGAVRLRDVLFITRAKPKDAEQEATWKALADDTLAAPDTWEVALSAGGKEQDKRATWKRLLSEDKLGAMALMRNLRNMEEAGVPRALVSAALVKANVARVLPFRFISAAKHAPNMEPALETLMFARCAEMPKLKGKTAIVVDHSGSMQDKLSAKSEMTRFESATAVAMLLRELCESVDVIAYSNEAQVVPPRRGFALRDAVASAMSWGGTDTAKAKKLADTLGYDRIVIVTDEQSHTALTAPAAGKPGYVVNVGCYKNGIGYGAWTHIDGFSSSVIDYIAANEGMTLSEAEAE